MEAASFEDFFFSETEASERLYPLNSSLPAAGLAAAFLESHNWFDWVYTVYLCFPCGREQEVSEEKHAISKLGL